MMFEVDNHCHPISQVLHVHCIARRWWEAELGPGLTAGGQHPHSTSASFTYMIEVAKVGGSFLYMTHRYCLRRQTYISVNIIKLPRDSTAVIKKCTGLLTYYLTNAVYGK